MGFWSEAFNFAANVVTVGGHSRIKAMNQAIQREETRHRSILSSVSFWNEYIRETSQRLRDRVKRTKRDLKSVKRILYAHRQIPVQTNLPSTRRSQAGKTWSMTNHLNVVSVSEYASLKYALAGTGAGTIVAAGAWGTVQVLGTASTGTAIGGLYGAAASNAGWAWFGGGSLATGGGGMAVGTLVLPMVGVAAGIATAGILAHNKADKLGKQCEELRKANDANQLVLDQLQSNVRVLDNAEAEYVRAHEELCSAFLEAKRGLFRFGFLSYLWRQLRFLFTRIYYTDSDLKIVNELEGAVASFFERVMSLGCIGWQVAPEPKVSD